MCQSSAEDDELALGYASFSCGSQSICFVVQRSSGTQSPFSIVLIERNRHAHSNDITGVVRPSPLRYSFRVQQPHMSVARSPTPSVDTRMSFVSQWTTSPVWLPAEETIRLTIGSVHSFFSLSHDCHVNSFLDQFFLHTLTDSFARQLQPCGLCTFSHGSPSF